MLQLGVHLKKKTWSETSKTCVWLRLDQRDLVRRDRETPYIKGNQKKKKKKGKKKHK